MEHRQKMPDSEMLLGRPESEFDAKMDRALEIFRCIRLDQIMEYQALHAP